MIPIHCMNVTTSCTSVIEAIMAVGNSAAPSIVPSPVPTFGTPIEKQMTGTTTPNNPRKKAYFHRPSCKAPSVKKVGGKNRHTIRVALVVIRKLFV